MKDYYWNKQFLGYKCKSTNLFMMLHIRENPCRGFCSIKMNILDKI